MNITKENQEIVDDILSLIRQEKLFYLERYREDKGLKITKQRLNALCMVTGVRKLLKKKKKEVFKKIVDGYNELGGEIKDYYLHSKYNDFFSLQQYYKLMSKANEDKRKM